VRQPHYHDLEQRIRELEADDVESAKEVYAYRAASENHLARIRELEAALDERRSPKAAAWKYLDDGVTLLKAAMEAIPERYRDGEPNQLHAAIKEWLDRPSRAENLSTVAAVNRKGEP
jgi:hypothetical protein